MRAMKNSLSPPLLFSPKTPPVPRIAAPVFETPTMPLPTPKLLLLRLSMLTHKPSSLTGQVVGPGVLDAGAEHPAGVVAVALAEESAAVPDKRAGQGRPGADVERRRKLGATVEAAEAAVVAAVVGEGDTAGGVHEHAIEGVADPETGGGEPVVAVVADAGAAVVEQGDVGAGRRHADDAEARRQERRNRVRGEQAAIAEAEEALVAVVAAHPLDVGFDADHEARARRELIVEADLSAADEAVAVAPSAAEPDRRDRRERSRHDGRHHAGRGVDEERAGAEAANAVVVVVVVPAVAGVHADIEASPGEDRDGHEDGGSAPREVRGHSSGGEAQKGYRGEQKLFHRRDPRCLMVVDHAFSKLSGRFCCRFRATGGQE